MIDIYALVLLITIKIFLFIPNNMRKYEKVFNLDEN